MAGIFIVIACLVGALITGHVAWLIGAILFIIATTIFNDY